MPWALILGPFHAYSHREQPWLCWPRLFLPSHLAFTAHLTALADARNI